jgi:hypothetical protein
MASVAGGVQHRCPPIRCRRPGSGGPAVRYPARPVSGHLGSSSRCPAVRSPAVHPSGVQPSGVHPASVQPAGVRPVGPEVSVCSHTRRWRWAQVVRRAPVTTGRVESRWAAAPLSGSVDGPAGPDASGAADSRVGQRGVGGGPGPGWVRRRRLPAERPCQAGGRIARGWRRSEAQDEAAARGGRTCRVAAVGAWVATTVGGSREACRPSGRARRGRGACWRGWACGPSAAQPGSRHSRLAAGSALTCEDGWWACQDLNLGPHPYQQSRAERYADHRFPRSPANVRGEVICC